MPKRTGRVTIGLYNSYDPRRFHEIHARTIARAAPLCVAFDFKLALFGFPLDDLGVKTPHELAEYVAEETTIGASGREVLVLAERNLLEVYDYPVRGFPPQLGTIVGTTCRPDERRAIEPEDVVREVLRPRSVTLVFGLGRRGLPAEVLEACEYHLDITGRRISLETATAIGAVTAVIGHLIEKEARRVSR
ncbi:DUF531 family protein [Methanopyrus kandleri]